MNVFEILNYPTLSQLKLLAGSCNIYQDVSMVTVVDTPDGAKWLRGKEAVITTAYAVKDLPEGLDSLIRILSEQNAAALIIKVNRFIETIPQSAIDLAEQLALPLISCPEEYAFVDIINPVLSTVIDRQSEILRHSYEIHKKFIEHGLNNNTITEILGTLSSVIGTSVAFVDLHFKKCYYSDRKSDLFLMLENLAFQDITLETLHGYRFYKVANESKSFGYIIYRSQDFDMKTNHDSEIQMGIFQTAMEYASVVIILRMHMKMSNQVIEEKYHETFVGDLVIRNIRSDVEIFTRAHLYSWDISKGGFVLIVDINNIKKYYLKKIDSQTNEKLENYVKIIFQAAIRAITLQFPTAKYYRKSDFITFVVPEQIVNTARFDEKIAMAFDYLKHEIDGKVPFTVTLAIGGYVKNMRNIYKSYNQAVQAASIGYQLENFDCILEYKKLGIYRVLTAVANSPESSDLYEQYLQKLVEYDEDNRTDFMHTLKIIISCGWNLKTSASKLYIHYNSVKYRFQKICHILELDLKEHDYQLAVELALKIYLLNDTSTSLKHI